MAAPQRPAEPAPRSGALAGVAARTALLVLLGGWVGAWLLFGLVVAPTAFRVLPSIEEAGTLVGPVLSALHLYGVVAGVLLAALALALGRGLACTALPLAMSAACAYSQFGVSAEISEIRQLAFGPHGSEAAAARFTHLHHVSVVIFVCVGIAALALCVLHARADEASASP
jgi:Domain of unknown function (DUF4149)